uniref:Uncharacterized protein n=1 Tax=Anopheles atroparvus TaxID=41427 RepID=A0A182J6T4_ANOAO
MHLPHYLPEVFLILLTVLKLTKGSCILRVSYTCELAIIDMRSDGMEKLQMAVASSKPPPVVRILRLIVPTVPSGTLLLRLAHVAESVVYDVYRENVFILPAGIDIMELYLRKAPQLRSFKIGGASRVRQLIIGESLLDHIPPMMGKLRSLQHLSLTNGKLTVLLLDLVLNVSEVVVLNVAFNQISQLSLNSNYSVGSSALQDLDLGGNRLEFLDMAVFAPFKFLEQLTLTGNRLKRLESSKPTTLPALKTLGVQRNNLTALHWDNGLFLPKLKVLILSYNAIAQLPTNWGPLRMLETLILEGNNLTVLDLSGFRSLATVRLFNLMNNQLETVISSGPNFVLPQLSFLNLSKNRISKMNLVGCQMPNLLTFIVNDNLLPTVPARIFNQSPNCETDEPFTCIISNINMSVDGMTKLESTMASAPFKIHYVRKLIVPNPPSGTFLQQMASLVDVISFDVFYEPVLQLLAANSLLSIELYSAKNLRTFVANGPNDYLKVLLIDQSLLPQIPPTLGKLRRLKNVKIMRSRLEVLHLDALASNGELVYLDLTGNRIARILPLTNSNVEMAVKEVDLTENLLEYLDMTIWGPFKALQIINLSNNRLVALDTPQPVGLGNLIRLNLDSNRLEALDLRQLTSPLLLAVTLNGNNFTEVPSTWGKKDALKLISMDSNHITTLDFGAFRSLTYLECDRQEFMVCIMSEVDMTSDGGSKLRRIIDADEQYYAAINIEKLIVSGSASGPFLQRIGVYTDSIYYERYRDAVFQLPAGNSLYEIDVGGSGVLRSFVAGQNSGLRHLFIRNCLLDRVPPTMGKMINLKQLVITECLLTGLRMDALTENRHLFLVDLSKNKIRQLFPITASWNTPESPVEHLILSENQIERLDLAVFAHFTQLQLLELYSNRIVQLGALAPVTLPNLARITVAVNKIASFDLSNATLPKLVILFLDENELPEVPVRWGTMPSLTDLSLEQNRLKRLDLSLLRPLRSLENVYFANNQIDSVRATTAVRMPQLEHLEMAGNQISAINLTGCDFPNINFVGLSNNQLKTVPPLFQRFPKVRLAMEGNPIKCSTLKPLMNRLVEGRLVMVNMWEPQLCKTSGIVINEYQHACCDP